MEMKVIEETKTRLVADLEGSDATLCNSLKKELQSDSKVKAASYAISHPSIGIPRIVIETDGKEPRVALADAAKGLKKTVSAFRKSFDKEF